MTHQLHRFATTTCKRPGPSDTCMFDTSPSRASRANASGSVAVLAVVRARRRRRRSGHG